MTMQQLMGMMQGLQEAMAASKAEQERMQADHTASQVRNDELHRTNEELRRGWRDVDESETGHPTKRILNAILTGDPRDSDLQHIHGSQSNLHKDGGP